MPEPDSYYRQWFAKNLWEPQSWRKSAHDLLAALSALTPYLVSEWKDVESNHKPFAATHGVYLMLAGFAAENILKLLIIRNLTKQNHSNTRIPKALKTHNLCDLCLSAKITLGPEEADLVNKLTDFVLWGGRYPAPTNFEDLKPVTLSFGIDTFRLPIHPQDIRNTEALLLRLASLARGLHVDISILKTKPERWETWILAEMVTMYIPPKSN